MAGHADTGRAATRSSRRLGLRDNRVDRKRECIVCTLATNLTEGKIMVDLGDRVADTVSGFRGIAVSKHLYLKGINRVTVQPLVDGDGKLPEAETFDEPQLEVSERA